MRIGVKALAAIGMLTGCRPTGEPKESLGSTEALDRTTTPAPGWIHVYRAGWSLSLPAEFVTMAPTTPSEYYRTADGTLMVIIIVESGRTDSWIDPPLERCRLAGLPCRYKRHVTSDPVSGASIWNETIVVEAAQGFAAVTCRSRPTPNPICTRIIGTLRQPP